MKSSSLSTDNLYGILIGIPLSYSIVESNWVDNIIWSLLTTISVNVLCFVSYSADVAQ